MGIKIDGTKGFGSLLELQASRRTETGKAREAARPQDKVEFSAVLKEVARGKETTSAASAHRAEKLKALQAQIDSGQYRPDLEKVAASLLNFIVSEKES